MTIENEDGLWRASFQTNGVLCVGYGATREEAIEDCLQYYYQTCVQRQ